jgi:microcin C transport system ATP-binding protein
MALLEIKNLSVTFKSHPQDVHAVQGISFSIEKGEILALVGESGSGKSTVALSILGLLPKGSTQVDMRFKDRQVSGADMRHMRGNRISMIFQEPMTALNPLHSIYRQIAEALTIHQPSMKSGAVRARVLELLGEVGLDALKSRLDALPHMLSGGERQRVMIAMAMTNNPDLLIADEPTTALDVTVQAQILGLLKSLQQNTGMAVLLITHDLHIVRKMADRVAVMERGEIVEQATRRTNRCFSGTGATNKP